MAIDVLVLFDHRQGTVAEANAELCRLAAELSDNWAGLVLIGPGEENVAKDLSEFCPKLYTQTAEALAPYNPETWIPAISLATGELAPRLIMMPHNPTALDLAPALAEKLSAPLSTDVISVEFEGDSIKTVRPVYGGKLTAEYSLKSEPVAVVTVRPGSYEPIAAGNAGVMTVLDAGEGPARLTRRFLEFIPASGGVDLSKAKIIVSVGRGIEGPENIEVAQELADALGAELGCSRPVADQGWLSKDHQVGISGQTVKPKVYIALGISGAYQHQAGMSGAETIIAVNRDPEAPIFDIAQYGVVADLFDVVPELVDVLGE